MNLSRFLRFNLQKKKRKHNNTLFYNVSLSTERYKKKVTIQGLKKIL